MVHEPGLRRRQLAALYSRRLWPAALLADGSLAGRGFAGDALMSLPAIVRVKPLTDYWCRCLGTLASGVGVGLVIHSRAAPRGMAATGSGLVLISVMTPASTAALVIRWRQQSWPAMR